MYVHRSNRTEALLAALAEVIATPLPDAFAKECIVVQGRGMERWLAQSLAARHGVFANTRFPFPRSLLEEVLASVLGAAPHPGIDYEPEAMMWSISELLPGLLHDPVFRPIARYLEDDPDGGLRVQLAQRIADTFDHYVTYRPEWVLAWEADDAAGAGRAGGGEADWQPVLWRALVERHGPSHLAARVRNFLDDLATRKPDPALVPQRLCFFGFSTLPPLYLAAFAAIARSIETHLFILSPTRDYWGDLRSEREAARRLRAAASGDLDEAALHFGEGHPLLASLGRVGREFQEILEAGAEYVEPAVDLYHDPLVEPAGTAAATMLEVLQSDILNLRDRSRSGAEDCAPHALRADDTSIRVHACHGPMREAEVLRDQLLALFARDATLEPRDVVVMCPDVDAYAPFVEAAFAGEGEHARIPCRFADRSGSAGSEIIDAFTRVLDALTGRLDTSRVLDLLGVEALRARFGIEVDDEETLHEWVKSAGIRWGMDAAHRGAEGLPEDDQNTWRFGLDRLLLGYAMPDDDGVLVGRRSPVVGVEGQAAGLLGRFAEFCETLFGLRARVAGSRSLDEWRRVLADVQARMLASDGENLHEHQRIRDGLEAIAEAGARAGFGGEVDLDTLRAQLVRNLDRSPRSSAFLAGGVTFCEMVPMRSIPFRVVCLMGLDDTAFPRVQRPLGFDLMARRPRPGDRSSREDDRYLFLEALLSARDHLILSYVGHDMRDNEPRPASVLVGELLDHLATAFVPTDPAGDASDAEAIRRTILVDHRMQPFSPAYFEADPQSALFSYSAQDFEAARALTSARATPGPFVTAPLPEPRDAASLEDAPRSVDLALLQRFLERPVEFCLRERLGLWLGDATDPVDDREPLDLAQLDRWRVGEALLARRLAGGDRAGELDVLRAEGWLPLGAAGAIAFAEVARDVDAIEGRVRALRGAVLPAKFEVDISVGPHRLVGALEDLYPAGCVRAGYARLGQRSELGAWARHLALCCSAPPGIATATHMVGRGESGKGGTRQIRFDPPEDARALLEGLIEVFELGRRSPLPLFPRTSRTYVETLLKGRDDPEGQATKNAYEEFESERSERNEAGDPFVVQAFGDVDPIEPRFHAAGSDVDRGSFRALAKSVFEPLLAHRVVEP